MSHAGGVRLLGPSAFANGLIVELIICCPTIVRLHVFVLLKAQCSSQKQLEGSSNLYTSFSKDTDRSQVVVLSSSSVSPFFLHTLLSYPRQERSSSPPACTVFFSLPLCVSTKGKEGCTM